VLLPPRLHRAPHPAWASVLALISGARIVRVVFWCSSGVKRFVLRRPFFFCCLQQHKEQFPFVVVIFFFFFFFLFFGVGNQ
jgi:hypothetical protein